MNCPRRARRDETGAGAALELVLFTPLLMGMILIILFAHRSVEATDQVSAAAYAAARSASLAGDEQDAHREGQRAAADALAERGRSCATMTTDIDTGGFTRGGRVRVTVTCIADLADLVGFGIPGHKSFTKTAVVPIDQHRVL